MVFTLLLVLTPCQCFYRRVVYLYAVSDTLFPHQCTAVTSEIRHHTCNKLNRVDKG